MPDLPRILIVTAAFGEGHNSAARNLALALNSMGAVTQVSDPCMLALPRLTRLVNWAYRYVTNHFPGIWGRIYRSTDRCDFGQQESWVLSRVEAKLADLVERFQPTAIVSTYPLYPYLLTRIFRSGAAKIPVFTVVTDSIEINAAWLRAESDYWLVTDAATRDSMVRKGMSAAKVVDTGFPVHPDFAKLAPVDAADGCQPFRVLYFPTSEQRLLSEHGAALLAASPTVSLTIILGRNLRRLYRRARALQLAYPGRVRLLAWTRRVPQLLNSHHLVVGKAGGATVHEAIAARCPMLIHHLVPGQEEGNLELLGKIGGGELADTARALQHSVISLLAADARAWRLMKVALARHDRNAGALAAAHFILHDSSSPAA